MWVDSRLFLSPGSKVSDIFCCWVQICFCHWTKLFNQFDNSLFKFIVFIACFYALVSNKISFVVPLSHCWSKRNLYIFSNQSKLSFPMVNNCAAWIWLVRSQTNSDSLKLCCEWLKLSGGLRWSCCTVRKTLFFILYSKFNRVIWSVPPASSAFKSSSAWLARRLIGLVFVWWALLSPWGAPLLFNWRGRTGWNLSDPVVPLADSSMDCCCDELGDDAALSLVSPTLELTDWLSLSPSST